MARQFNEIFRRMIEARPGSRPRLLPATLLIGLLILAASPEAHAELVLTNFSATNPLKIMPVGDSITDDCSTNGAWRAPLQPLLETNGVAFTNTGRLTSAGYAGFTKRRHEGYCGAVIGPPGVFAVYNYSTADAYLQRIVRDALAITNNRPDLVLILIGANDIGRGRNPWAVATNDMPNLLSVIFSNVPNAHVFLAKTTTLQNAGIGYGVYATNVPIYNAALQRMVNQRRAAGQNVFLADMFSAVDYSTGFLADHLHPNPVGLKAIAAEWAARIQTILRRPDRFSSVLIPGGAVWNYSDTGQDLGTNWAQPDFNDSGWSNGIARFGYGDLATATPVSFGSDASNKFITTYFRGSFVVASNAVITNLNFRLARSDGAAVWLNGQELFRVNLPAGPISYTTPALTQMTGYTAHIFYPTNFAMSLPPGTNTLAVELHQSSVTNSTLGFDMELISSGFWLPAPSLSIMRTGNSLQLTWPITNGTFALYSATNPSATDSWILAAMPQLTNNGMNVVTQALDATTKFFRLQR
jgi:lysophospholipase L1-like esterase